MCNEIVSADSGSVRIVSVIIGPIRTASVQMTSTWTVSICTVPVEVRSIGMVSIRKMAVRICSVAIVPVEILSVEIIPIRIGSVPVGVHLARWCQTCQPARGRQRKVDSPDITTARPHDEEWSMLTRVLMLNHGMDALKNYHRCDSGREYMRTSMMCSL